MKKLGSIEFFENIDLDIKLDFNDLMDFIFAGKLLVKGVTDNDIIKQTFFDENNLLKMDKIELAVNQYFYLVAGATTDGDYTAGVIKIEFYGTTA